MDTLCRLCTTKTPALTSVFSFKNERLIADMISLICPVKIDPSDNYPKGVCLSCLRIVMEAYDLREKSVQSDVKFKTGKFATKDSNAKQSEKIVKKSETSKSTEPARLPEVANIKVEKDPFNSAIEFVDENFVAEDEKYESNESGNDCDDDDDEDYQEIIPVEPKVNKKYKYDRISVGGFTKFKCSYCVKTFSNTQNVNRHIQADHEIKKDSSTSCNICGIFVSHRTNLKRHIRMHHPDHHSPNSRKIKNEHLQDIVENSSELTRRVFNTSKKQKYMEYINVIVFEPNSFFKYQCLVCMRETGKSKVWSQSISNGGTSNIRRHLSTLHPEDFRRIEASLAGESGE